MTKMTDNEFKALDGIVCSQFQDSADVVGNHVWSWSANNFDNPRSFSGAVSSLVKKGWADSYEYEPNEPVIAITEDGFQAYNAMKTAKAHVIV